MMSNNWMPTISGKRIDLDCIEQTQVDLNDICRTLANIPRYAGRCTMGWTVAHHSIFTGLAAAAKCRAEQIPTVEMLHFVKEAVAHDFEEAFLGDIPSPLARKLGPAWEEIKKDMKIHVRDQLGMRRSGMFEDQIKVLDALAIHLEVFCGVVARGSGDWGFDTRKEPSRVSLLLMAKTLDVTTPNVAHVLHSAFLHPGWLATMSDNVIGFDGVLRPECARLG